MREVIQINHECQKEERLAVQAAHAEHAYACSLHVRPRQLGMPRLLRLLRLLLPLLSLARHS